MTRRLIAGDRVFYKMGMENLFLNGLISEQNQLVKPTNLLPEALEWTTARGIAFFDEPVLELPTFSCPNAKIALAFEIQWIKDEIIDGWP